MTSSNLVEKLSKRVIQNFMDVLILTEMKKGSRRARLRCYRSYSQKIRHLAEFRHRLLLAVFFRKRRFRKGRLEPTKKSLCTSRERRTKHKSYH